MQVDRAAHTLISAGFLNSLGTTHHWKLTRDPCACDVSNLAIEGWIRNMYGLRKPLTKHRRLLSFVALSALALYYFCFALRDTIIPNAGRGQVVCTTLSLPKQVNTRWKEEEITNYLSANPQRASFSDLFLHGGFRHGMEVGVADGRFSELFFKRNAAISFHWHMVEPYPNDELRKRFKISTAGTPNFRIGLWASTGVGKTAFKSFSMQLSLEPSLIDKIPDEGHDFIYLDGAHDYKNVKDELPLYYQKIRPGGVLAGHDYCNYGEAGLRCIGCQHIPRCGNYTEYGVAHGKKNGLVNNQAGVVYAVQEWVLEEQPKLRIYYTSETFTRESLRRDGIEYDLVITSTRNPSWFVVKPDFELDL